MSRLIDADAYAAELWKLRENYQMLDDTHTADKIMHGIFRAEQTLKEQPTVDAVPVVHGHWEIVPNDENRDDYYKMRCSVCGETLWSIQSEELYCCKCGAKMDECADGERRTDGHET